jgi:hypothetical protein
LQESGLARADFGFMSSRTAAEQNTEIWWIVLPEHNSPRLQGMNGNVNEQGWYCGGVTAGQTGSWQQQERLVWPDLIGSG